MRVSRSDLAAGLRDVVPLVLSELPFGVVIGAAAVDAGVPAAAAVGMSVLIYTGAAQLAAFDLLGREAPLAVVALTALVVNLRYLMYSASLAQYLRRLSRPRRWTFGYLLTDPVYALTIGEFAERPTAGATWYYVGAAVPMWVAYQGGTVLGILLGTSVPPSLNLGFATPLLFLALLVPTLEDRPSLAAAGVGGSVAVLGAGVPLELGLVVGSLAGVATGLLAERGWAQVIALGLWAVALVVGLGTFAFRLSFIEAFASAEGVPPNVRAALRYVPPAVLAALVLPAFLLADGSLAVGPGNDRLLAGGVAAVVAWRTGSVLGTLVVGMTALYLLRSGIPVQGQN